MEEETDGFSGSEIEQVIISGLYTSFSVKKELSTEVLLKEILLTVPISVSMADKISYLRHWAKDKTVNAG